MIPYWLFGIFLSLTASFFGTLGKILLKFYYISTKCKCLIMFSSCFCIFLLNPGFDALSYAYAAQTLLAPMAGLSVVWNIILAPLILKEVVFGEDLQGALIVLCGCILVGISGDHNVPEHSIDAIYGLFCKKAFLFYSVLMIATCILLYILIKTLKKDNVWRRFAFGSLSGITGGNLFFLKASVELITKHESMIWLRVETYLIILGAFLASGVGIFVLNEGLKEYDALYIVALYQAFLILIGSLSGMVFFNEGIALSSYWKTIIYPCGIIIVIIGIFVLSRRRTIPVAVINPRLSFALNSEKDSAEHNITDTEKQRLLDPGRDAVSYSK